MLTSLLERVRQRRFPPEFRIAQVLAPLPVPPQPPPVPRPEQSGDFSDAALADLATNLWRTVRKIAPEGQEDLPRAQRQAARHLRAMSEVLAESGVSVQDHDGLAYDPGLTLDVLAYEERPGVTREVVVETIRPSVYRSGRTIQIGQVIVAQPERGGEQ
ncbi:hypothetical protein BC739_000028 [Kutzneria viridogrisea]|uniref:Nucleotide exchange factor GrpE n=2 Tax=Kutzneria TaxID=43356 RepID=W5WEJ5_9PSEU|nr:hypothetical protein [Kutzneria albida]AHH99613.1 hypothetical protein KALB_6253 [Kutzneria albida DSM 43870]MBA8922831.1 hypothetical protein [Kutzneria viridogrisea]